MTVRRSAAALIITLAVALTLAVAVATAPAARASDGTISGTVYDASTDQPVTGSRIIVEVTRWDPVEKEWSGGPMAYVDGDSGTYVLSNVPAGTWKVRMVDPLGKVWATQYSGGTISRLTAIPVTVTSGQTSTCDFHALHGGKIAGTITDVAGKPLGKTDVEAYLWTGVTIDRGTMSFGKSAADGTYVIGGLPAGEYCVIFGDQGVIYGQQYWNNVDIMSLCTPVTVAADVTTPGIDAAMRPPVAPVFSAETSYVRVLSVVKGKAQADAKVRVAVDGKAVGAATAGATCSWAVKVTGKYAQGSHTAAARATNGLGTGPAGKARVVVDRTGPVVSAPTATSCSTGGTVLLPFVVRDKLSPSVKVTIKLTTKGGRVLLTRRLGAVPTGAGDDSFACTFAPGSYRFVVFAVDLAGNVQVKPASNALVVK